MLTDVKEIKDKAILEVKTTAVKEAVAKDEWRAAETPAWVSRTSVRTT